MSPATKGSWNGGLRKTPSSPQSMVGRMLPVHAKPDRKYSALKFSTGTGVRNWIGVGVGTSVGFTGAEESVGSGAGPVLNWGEGVRISVIRCCTMASMVGCKSGVGMGAVVGDVLPCPAWGEGEAGDGLDAITKLQADRKMARPAARVSSGAMECCLMDMLLPVWTVLLGIGLP